MKYQKHSNAAYNLHIINTSKFKTIMVKINFKNKMNRNDITYRNLLSKVLLESSFNYPNKRSLEIECENLYNLSIGGAINISGHYIISSFSSFFLNEKYTETEMNKKSLKFILDLLFHPDIKNNGFNFFELSKSAVSDEIEKLKENPRKYSLIRLLEEMDDSLAYNSVGYKDDLDNITNTSLYNYYLKMLKSDLIDIFIIGDVDNQNFKKQIEQFFTINTIKKKGPTHFIKHKKIRKRAKTVKETIALEQSKLNIGFKLDNLTDFEQKYVLSIYSFILGGSPDSKLFKNVREKHSLCYSISCTHRPVSNIMIISAGIDASDYTKCLNLIKKEIKKITKGEFNDEEIEAAKLTYISSLKEIEDSPANIVNIYESHEYLNFDLLEERMKNIFKVKKEDIIKLSKKIYIDTVYLLGGKDEDH